MKKINTLYNCTGYPQLFESESTSSESTSSESISSESTSSESTSSESTSSESTSSEATSSEPTSSEPTSSESTPFESNLYESDFYESTSSESTSSESATSELIQIDDIDVLQDKLVALIRDNDTKKAEEVVTRIDELEGDKTNFFPYRKRLLSYDSTGFEVFSAGGTKLERFLHKNQ